MRGAPLIRTFLILAALAVSGIGFARLTRERPAATGGQDAGISESASVNLISAKVHVTYSRPVNSHELRIGEEIVGLTLAANGVYQGSVSIDPGHPVAFLRVSSIPPETAGSHLFAKLVVEAEGKETFTHVFDAAGDIDDFVELPF